MKAFLLYPSTNISQPFGDFYMRFMVTWASFHCFGFKRIREIKIVSSSGFYKPFDKAIPNSWLLAFSRLLYPQTLIAQLGERGPEEAKVACSIHPQGIVLAATPS
jgi:hypothetical protein